MYESTAQPQKPPQSQLRKWLDIAAFIIFCAFLATIWFALNSEMFKYSVDGEGYKVLIQGGKDCVSFLHQYRSVLIYPPCDRPVSDFVLVNYTRPLERNT